MNVLKSEYHRFMGEFQPYDRGLKAILAFKLIALKPNSQNIF